MAEFGVPLKLFFPAPTSTLGLVKYDPGRVAVDQDAPEVRMRYVEIPADRTLGISRERFAGRPEPLEGIAKGLHGHGLPLAFRASWAAFIAAKSVELTEKTLDGGRDWGDTASLSFRAQFWNVAHGSRPLFLGWEMND